MFKDIQGVAFVVYLKKYVGTRYRNEKTERL